MKHFPTCLFSFLGIFFCCHLRSQTADVGKKWNLEDCFQYAKEHNIDINTLKLNEQSSAQDLKAAKGSKIPSVSASANNIFKNAKNDVSGNGAFVDQLSSSGTYLVNSSVVLWNGNFINNNIRQKELLTQTANLSVAQSANNITLLITQSYLAILLAKENLKYNIDLVITTSEKVKQSQQLYEAGSIAKTTVLQLQAQLSSDKFLQVQTENSIRQNILTLKQILQLPSETEFDIVTPASIEVGSPVMPLKNVQQTAFQIFPEIKIGQLGVDIATLNIEKAKAGFKPTLSANAALGSSYIDVLNNSTYTNSGYFSQTSNNLYELVGLSLSIPIFSNWINKTNLEKAKIGYKQANLSFKNTQIVLSQEVEQAYLNTSNAKQAYDAAKEQLLAVTETYRIGNEQFRLGGINSFDLLQLRNQYVQAVQAFTQAKYTAILQQKIYEFYNGSKITL